PLTLATPLSQTQMARFEGGSSPRARTNVPEPGPGRPFPGTNWQPRRPSARPALPPGAGGSALGRPDLLDAPLQRLPGERGALHPDGELAHPLQGDQITQPLVLGRLRIPPEHLVEALGQLQGLIQGEPPD